MGTRRRDSIAASPHATNNSSGSPAKADRHFNGKRPIAALAIALVILAISAALIVARSGKTIITTYALEQREADAYREVLASLSGFAPMSPAPVGGVPESRGKPHMLIGRLGAALAASSSSFSPIPADTLGRVPPSIRAAATDSSGRPFVMPVQIDPLLVAYGYEGFSKAGVTIGERFELADFDLALARYRDARSPAILFAGGDDETLLLVLSALCESRGGAPSYRKLVKAILDGVDPESLLALSLGIAPDGGQFSLGDLIGEIRAWSDKGYLHPEWYRLEPEDVMRYMKAKLGFVMLGTLSFRRAVPYEAIDGYGWATYPGRHGLGERAFIAPLTGVAISAPPARQSARLLGDAVEFLASSDTAFRLALATGRATTISAARAPDIQAADSLAWAAGRSIVVNGLFRDAFLSESSAKAFAEYVRAAVRR